MNLQGGPIVSCICNDFMGHALYSEGFRIFLLSQKWSRERECLLLLQKMLSSLSLSLPICSSPLSLTKFKSLLIIPELANVFVLLSENMCNPNHWEWAHNHGCFCLMWADFESCLTLFVYLKVKPFLVAAEIISSWDILEDIFCLMNFIRATKADHIFTE